MKMICPKTKECPHPDYGCSHRGEHDGFPTCETPIFEDCPACVPVENDLLTDEGRLIVQEEYYKNLIKDILKTFSLGQYHSLLSKIRKRRLRDYL